MKRILLFLGTNIAIMVVLSVVLSVIMAVTGIHGIQTQNGSINFAGLLLLAAVFGFGGSFISLLMSKWMAKMSMGVQVIDQPRSQSEAWLMETVQRLSRQAGLPMPEVGVFDSPQMNAFATGATKKSSLVAVSTGLLHGMSRDEVEAVLAHEISHVANGDMVTLTLIQGVINTFVIFIARIVGHIVDRVVLKREGSGYGIGYYVTVFVTEIFLAILASVIVMWFSRKREFRADAGSANLVGRGKMIAALRRLQAEYEPEDMPGQLAAFGINGGKGSGLRRLFMSHPPLEERIAALEAMR
ncbi:protease HtpX [Acidihalobacter ferrooxydans]|uniref:Protease HtpX n=1 Tax=Acidihalobacter ferrooxydans TaxID=1765967 RepID=A0A1P8UF18_9GAMM|nr:protease HtpX [Acidihalobacter ferrooxydans]APZ42388.1 zinc metalloprotease HtpX [Acidihalobacter ferrooxydans]